MSPELPGTGKHINPNPVELASMHPEADKARLRREENATDAPRGAELRNKEGGPIDLTRFLTTSLTLEFWEIIHTL